MKRVPPTFAAAGAIWVAACVTCDASDLPGTATTSSVATATTSSTSSTTPDAGNDGGDAGCPDENVPSQVPIGWDEVTDWSCDCRLFIPGSPEALPEPVTWKPCPDHGDGLDCRQMVTDWTIYDAALPMPKFARILDGRPALAMRRNAWPVFTDMIAELDGPVHNAMLMVWSDKNDPGCKTSDASLSSGKYLFNLRGDDADSKGYSSAEGAYGGKIGEPPAVLTRDDTDLVVSWYASDKLLARVDTTFALSVTNWSFQGETFITSPATDPDGLQTEHVIVRDDAVFWTASNAYAAGLMIWTPEGGVQPLVRWIGDGTRGARNLGTDGENFVWSEGEGKAANEPYYPVRRVMAATYTTDPKKLEPRTLRSHPGSILGARQWVVGCGMAANGSTAPNQVAVVRISDGWSWTVPVYNDMALYEAVGITCNEVIVWGAVEGRSTVGRIRLDSLGPGVAPD